MVKLGDRYMVIYLVETVFILPFQAAPAFLTESNAQHASKHSSKSAGPAANVFSKFDVMETSYHIVCDQIDLHLCDDPGSKSVNRHKPEIWLEFCNVPSVCTLY